MKSSIIRSLAIFSMGAACATVAGGLYGRDPTSPEDFQKRATRTLNDVEWLGRYVYKAEDGHIYIESSSVGACVPVPPTPILPAGAVDLRSLRRGLEAVKTLNDAYLLGEIRPVSEVEKCRG